MNPFALLNIAVMYMQLNMGQAVYEIVGVGAAPISGSVVDSLTADNVEGSENYHG